MMKVRSLPRMEHFLIPGWTFSGIIPETGINAMKYPQWTPFGEHLGAASYFRDDQYFTQARKEELFARFLACCKFLTHSVTECCVFRHCRSSCDWLWTQRLDNTWQKVKKALWLYFTFMSLKRKYLSSSLVPGHHCLLILNLQYVEYLATNCDSAVYPVRELCLPIFGWFSYGTSGKSLNLSIA